MKFLGVGEYCDLGAMYLRLMQAGHDVKVYVEHADYHDIYAGMLNFTSDWQNELDWIAQAGQDGIIIFESATKGKLQDDLRLKGFQVIGGSEFGDKLEADREFGQQIMQEMDMCVAKTFQFNDYATAIQFIADNKARYVYKNNGADSARTRNYIGMLDDGSDLQVLLDLYKQQNQQNQHSGKPHTADFVLMQYISGIEIGVGAYFNGENFLQPACLDWEHKRFFSGNLGELTGEMGTVVTYDGAEIIFKRTLVHLADKLKASGYCGYINLNMIANEKGLWPLEFTSRFGYPGYSICSALHQHAWDSIFRQIFDKSSLILATHAGFATGVVLTVPPFPYTYGYAALSKGTPILFAPSITDDEMQHLHFSEVKKDKDYLVTSGVIGCIGTSIGRGDTVSAACLSAYQLAAKVIVPNIRYRKDIGANLMANELQQLKSWGYIK